MQGELLQKYIWLVQLFVRAGSAGLSLDEVSRKWEDRWRSTYSRRTFSNHRESIEEIFGIRIECSRANNRYFIPSSKDVADEEAANNWLINTFTVNNLLTQSHDRLSGRVSVEDIPSGHRYLTEVMDAMEDDQVLVIQYKKYKSTEASTLTVYPYAVKEAVRRWYLIGYCKERNAIRVYGMDRILSMEKTGEHFKMPARFDVDELFASSYGVYLPEGQKSQKIVFRADKQESRFLIDLPIHDSQKIESSDEESTTFSIRVCPNESLLMDLIQRGSKIEVLQPESLRNAIKEEIIKTLKLYD